jgi:hypothetical protein
VTEREPGGGGAPVDANRSQVGAEPGLEALADVSSERLARPGHRECWLAGTGLERRRVVNGDDPASGAGHPA